MNSFLIKLTEEHKIPLITHNAIQVSISFTKKGKTINLHLDAVKIVDDKVVSLDHVSPSECHVIMNTPRCNVQKLQEIFNSVKSDVEKRRGTVFKMLTDFVLKHNMRI
jgi:hypothetical protein